MIIKPKIRGFICTTAHPDGCKKHVQEQIDFVKAQEPINNGPKKVLIIGSSTGYGLGTRIVSAFGGSKAATVGVFFEKEAEGKRTASSGWYNTAAFEAEALKEGLYAKSFNGDAFSDEMKQQVAQCIKKDLGKVDLVVYSLASPRRQHPKTGEVAKSVLKPVGQDFSDKSLDVNSGKLETVSLPEASEEEIQQTISVMGGEDWQMWIDCLKEAGVLEDGVKTIAYTYIGPEVTNAIYRSGTIGKAKENLEQTAAVLTDKLKSINGTACISVNKALVTQSSSAIPFIPLYYVLLKKILVEKSLEENCVQQMYRLFHDQLFSENGIRFDEQGFIRMDDLEMLPEIQSLVSARWKEIDDNKISEFADLEGYRNDFMRLFGFGLNGVDYEAEANPSFEIPSLDK